jgi:hypothetical protein
MSHESRVAAPILLVLALFIAADDADARGRRGGGSRSSSSAPRAHDNDGNTVNLTVRNTGNSSASSSPDTDFSGPAQQFTRGSMSRPVLPQRAADKPYTPEEIARHEAALAAYERDQAEYARMVKVASEKAETQRTADEKAAADKAARKAAEENAEDAKAAAALAEKKRADAAIAADVNRVLQRAKADYPVLETPEGEPVLRMILARQQALAARGIYPSIAMVEAVADHASMLVPRAKPQPLQASAPVSEEPSKAFGNCYWKTPSVWACR